MLLKLKKMLALLTSKINYNKAILSNPFELALDGCAFFLMMKRNSKLHSDQIPAVEYILPGCIVVIVLVFGFTVCRHFRSIY